MASSKVMASSASRNSDLVRCATSSMKPSTISDHKKNHSNFASMAVDGLLLGAEITVFDTASALDDAETNNALPISRQENFLNVRKTVDDVWKEIVAGDRKQCEEKASDEVMTSEGFLRGGAVEEGGVKMPLMLTDSGTVIRGGGRGKRRAAVLDPLDKAAQQRQRRMVKNRESAAGSRERKQTTVPMTPLNTRCSPKRFVELVQSLDKEKKKAIVDIGFGGLLDLHCKVLRRELCAWLLIHYNAPLSRLELEGNGHIPITPHHVQVILGVPSQGKDLVVKDFTRDESIQLPSLTQMEESIRTLEVGDEFKRRFALFACATILAPTSRLEGNHGLLYVVQDVAAIPLYNWGKYVLDGLAKGKKAFRKDKTYIPGCLLFLQMFYLHHVHVGHGPVASTIPAMSVWTDKLIDERIKWEQEELGGFGKGVSHKNPNMQLKEDEVPVASSSFELSHASDGEEDIIMATLARTLSREKEIEAKQRELQILQEHQSHDLAFLAAKYRESKQGGSSGYMSPQFGPLSTCAVSYSDQAPRIAHLSDSVHDLPTSLVRKDHCMVENENHEALKTNAFGYLSILPVQTNALGYSPASSVRNEPNYLCRSPFVLALIKKYSSIREEHKTIVDYAFDMELSRGEILVQMHGKYLQRNELASLLGEGPVSGMVVDMFARMMNVNEGRGRRHIFESYLMVPLIEMHKKPKKSVIDEEDYIKKLFEDVCAPEVCGYNIFNCQLLMFPLCLDTHWVMFVLNLREKRIEILDSLNLHPQQGIKTIIKNMIKILEQLYEDFGGNEFNPIGFPAPHMMVVEKQKNMWDAGVMVIKYMEFWDCPMAKEIKADLTDAYRFEIAASMILSKHNLERDRVISKAR